MLGNKLAELRAEMGLTQTELAAKLSISRVNYNRYEKNERTPDSDTLVKLANFFNVTTDFLLGNSILKRPAERIAFHLEEDELDPEDIELIKNLYETLKKRHKK